MTLTAFRAWVAPRLLAFVWLNALLVMGLAFGRGLDHAWTISAVAVALAAGASLIAQAQGPRFATRAFTSVALCGFGALYLACAEGSGVILDVHMTFFALLSIAAAWCCWRSLMAAALFIVLHHFVLNELYPSVVFPAASSMSRVLLHGGIVAVQVAGLCLLTDRLAKAFKASKAALSEAEAARARADHLARDHQAIAERESRAHQTIVELARSFPATIAELRAAFDAAAREMHDTSQQLAAMSSEASELAGKVEQCAAATAEGAPMVQMATQELTSAIGGIAERMSDTAILTCEGRDKASEADRQADELARSIERIASFVDIIRNVANQTNLLALNATIEAARAGAARRGVAGVAGGGKIRSAPTAAAAVAIESQVAEVIAISKRTVDGVRFFSTALDSIDESAMEIAASVEEQHAAIQEIANAVSFISDGAERMKEFSAKAATAAERTRHNAFTTGSAASTVQAAAARLNDDVEKFLERLVGT